MRIFEACRNIEGQDTENLALTSGTRDGRGREGTWSELAQGFQQVPKSATAHRQALAVLQDDFAGASG